MLIPSNRIAPVTARRTMRRRKIRFLNPEIGAFSIQHPIPLHIAAMGPRGRALTSKLGAGWVPATANVRHGQAGIAAMQAAWRDAGRDPASFHATATIAGCV